MRHAAPHALEIARVAQEAVRPDAVILFGSRAVGDHREDSDVDILVVTEGGHHRSARSAAEKAARRHTRDNPPELELGVISMDRRTFDRCRRANQHIAGQAARHGIPMSNTLPGLNEKLDQGPNGHWPATRQWLEFTQRNRRSLDTLARDHKIHRTIVGFTAQQAASGILRAWLSTHNDPWRYRHGLELIWKRIQDLEGLECHQAQRAIEAARELMEYTRGESSNWLDPYRDISGDGPDRLPITREQQDGLRERVGKLVDEVTGLIQQRHGIPATDIPEEGPET